MRESPPSNRLLPSRQRPPTTEPNRYARRRSEPLTPRRHEAVHPQISMRKPWLSRSGSAGRRSASPLTMRRAVQVSARASRTSSAATCDRVHRARASRSTASACRKNSGAPCFKISSDSMRPPRVFLRSRRGRPPSGYFSPPSASARSRLRPGFHPSGGGHQRVCSIARRTCGKECSSAAWSVSMARIRWLLVKMHRAS